MNRTVGLRLRLFTCVGNLLFLTVLICTGGFVSLAYCQQPTDSGNQKKVISPVVPSTIYYRPIGIPLYQIAPVGQGFVDLHTHPLANLGFGRKLLYGGVDVGALLPSDPNCQHNQRATSVQQALGHDNSTHGGVNILTNTCGDDFRVLFVHKFQQDNNANDPPDDASGYPNFPDWPKWNDITHQKMWVDWIQRAYGAGLRVMIALAVNNKTTADAVAGSGDGPDDDKASADLQIAETKSFVGRHSDFMQIAYSSADIQTIVNANKLAVVLGVELDNFGNMNTVQPLTADAISVEISRLYGEGVRYIFPIHVIDNPLGGTAVYQPMFNLSNLREAGHYWNLACAPANDNITFIYQPSGFDLELAAFEAVKLGLIQSPFQPAPAPAGCSGMVNAQGLTTLGAFAIQEMMRHGMLIDIDHMSEASMNQALAIAEQVQGGYPLNSGHSGLRCFQNMGCNERALTAAQYARIFNLHGMAGVGSANLTAYQWTQLYSAVSQAMGVSTSGGSAVVAGAAFGTDTDGLAPGMPTSTAQYTQMTVQNPNYSSCVAQKEKGNCLSGDMTAAQLTTCRNNAEGACLAQYPATVTSSCSSNCVNSLPAVEYGSSFPMSSLGGQSWDYNVDGVAHYGMLADFLQAVKTAPGGTNVIANLMNGANYFYETWMIAEARCSTLSNGANCATSSSSTNSGNTGNSGHSGPIPSGNCPKGQVYNEQCTTCLAPRQACPTRSCPPGEAYVAGSGCLKPGQHPK